MRKATLRRRVAATMGGLVLAAGIAATLSGTASADSASDDRATFHEGNATTCDAVDFPNDTLLISPDSPATGTTTADSNVSGTVNPNTGSIQPGTNNELDVTLLADNVVIDAIVVKGGSGYNVYSDSDVLPPALQPPQHYIAPLNNGGNVPAISHWFVCYHTSKTPVTGSLSVTKTVIPPLDSTAVVPSSFSVHIACDSGSFDETISVGNPATITGLPDGDVCVVTETTDLPPGSVVKYTPSDANTAGVTVAAGQEVAVGIENDFTNVAGEQVVKPVTPTDPGLAPAQAVQASPAFTG
jgi:hypothetical protein